jgi:alanine racemase
VRTTNWLEIDLHALARNAQRVQQLIGERCELWAVVKADAYGHGAVPVAHTLQQAGIPRFCVASLQEGVELREAGITAPLMLLLPPLSEAEWETVCHYRLEAVVEDAAHYRRALQVATRYGVPLNAHLEIDTGMSRLGWTPAQLPELLRLWRPDHPIRWRSVFTHFACADSDPAFTREQLNYFLGAVETLRRRGFPDVLRHVAASAALLTLPESRLEAVRCGLLLYGLKPLLNRGSPCLPEEPYGGVLQQVSREVEHFEPVLSWRARVLSVRTVPVGQGISYGWQFRAERPMRVATVGVGYADGYPITLSGRTEVILHGQRVPQIGRICMDMLMVDVTELPQTQPGDVATLIGSEGEVRIRIEELAQRLNTTPHELTSRLGKRPERRILTESPSE